MPINYCIAMHFNPLEKEAPKKACASCNLIDSVVFNLVPSRRAAKILLKSIYISYRILSFLNLFLYSFLQFKLKLLSTTLTELQAMAALAIIGFSKMPYMGNSTPAATGMPIRL